MMFSFLTLFCLLKTTLIFKMLIENIFKKLLKILHVDRKMKYLNIVEEGSVACLVLGTESCSVYILDPEAFTIMDSLGLPSPPVFLTATGTRPYSVFKYF